MSNVIDLLDHVLKTEVVADSEAFALTAQDTGTFLKVLRHIQSMSSSHSVDIKVRINELCITTLNETTKDQLGDVVSTTGLQYTTRIEAYLPLFDSLLDDEDESLRIIDSMIQHTMMGIDALQLND